MDQSSLSPNTSNQQLVINSDSDSATALLQEKKSSRREGLRDVTITEYMTVGILCFVNLINYIDRFTVAGILSALLKEFNKDNADGGLLQTVFIVAYMVFAPMFGYLGDRYSRRLLMASGVAFWSLTTLIGSFITNFWWFLIFRGLVGVGEASYSTIAPTIISDLFVGELRSKMLALFYFAIPVGCGLGYMVGAMGLSLTGDWRWGLRCTPALGAVAVALLLLALRDPPRGHAEASRLEPTDFKSDIKSLLKNPSFMLSTFGFTCVTFVTGALAWWGPTFLHMGFSMQPDVEISLERVSHAFGAITVGAGVGGVALGAWLGSAWPRVLPRAHPALCALGLLVSTPALAAAMLLSDARFYAPFALIFVAQVALNLNWAIVADMSLYVVIPPRRSTAEAFQILVSHMFGDAGSPFLIGWMSKKLEEWMSGPGVVPSPTVEFRALQYALFSTCFVEVTGAALFLLTAFYIVADKRRVDNAIAEAVSTSSEPTQNAQDVSDASTAST